MFSKLKQVKELRDQAKKIQNTLADETVEATAAWGKVKMVMNGNQEVLSVTIDPELVVAEKKDTLEKAIKEVTNDSIKKVQKVMAQKVQKMGGLSNLGL